MIRRDTRRREHQINHRTGVGADGAQVIQSAVRAAHREPLKYRPAQLDREKIMLRKFARPLDDKVPFPGSNLDFQGRRPLKQTLRFKREKIRILDKFPRTWDRAQAVSGLVVNTG